jgi:hypothetical protein
MWEESVKGFENNKFEYDQFLKSPIDDHRSGITIICKLNDDTSKRFLRFIDECKTLEPNQYFYNKEEIHVTILSILCGYF